MALFKYYLQIWCCFILVLISFQEAQASPLTSKQSPSERQRKIYQQLAEVFCVLKGGKSAEECLTDSEYFVNAFLQTTPNSEASSQADQLEESRLEHLLPLNLAANKRDAFYSDWRRRRR